MVTKVVVLGDSIVYGRIDTLMGGWVNRLRLWLDKKNPTAYAVFNLGIGGETTTRLLERCEFESKIRNPDLIFIMVGINDSRRINNINGENQTPLHVFRENLARIFKITKNIARTIYITMFPVDEKRACPYKTYYYRMDDLEEYVNVAKEVAKEEGIKVIDLFEYVINNIQNYENLLADGLHPNEKGHELIFNVIKQYIIENNVIRI